MSRCITEISCAPRSWKPYSALLGTKAYAELMRELEKGIGRLGTASFWQVNSTAGGGGVAEILHPWMGYALGAGLDARWAVIQGDAEFFRITKRVHNGLHNNRGDGGSLGPREAKKYESLLKGCAEALLEQLSRGDIVVLHDPQTAGLAPRLREAGMRVIWRCHIGHAEGGEYVTRSWDFLRPHVEAAERFVFSRKEYAPPWIPEERLHVIHPAIDPFSSKNQGMDPPVVRSTMVHLGMIQSEGVDRSFKPHFLREDGTSAEIGRHADIIHSGPMPLPDDKLVVQISRWDRLKDMHGVMSAFADHVADGNNWFLALAGPNVHGVADDPEAVDCFNECLEFWRALPHFKRSRIQLVSLPMRDLEENAAMVNAIQRHAAVVAQKSLYEGFGLTVTEAMWKARPVIASRIGGIPAQIDSPRLGVLVDHPTDLAEFGAKLRGLLEDSERAHDMGLEAHESVRERFLLAQMMEKELKLAAELATSQT